MKLRRPFWPKPGGLPSYDYHAYSGIEFIINTDLADYVTVDESNGITAVLDERNGEPVAFTQSTEASRPSFANGYIESGVGDSLDYKDGSLSLDAFSFVVIAYQNSAQDVEVFGHSASIDRVRFRNVATVGQLTIGGANSVPNLTLVANAWNLLGVRRSGTGAEYRVNGGGWTAITVNVATWVLDEFFTSNVDCQAAMFQSIQESQENLDAIFTNWNGRHSVY